MLSNFSRILTVQPVNLMFSRYFSSKFQQKVEQKPLRWKKKLKLWDPGVQQSKILIMDVTFNVCRKTQYTDQTLIWKVLSNIWKSLIKMKFRFSCPVDDKLISRFRGSWSETGVFETQVFAYMKTFRFTGSPALYIECDVRMCHGRCPVREMGSIL